MPQKKNNNFGDERIDKYLRIAKRTNKKRIHKKNMKKFQEAFIERLFGFNGK